MSSTPEPPRCDRREGNRLRRRRAGHGRHHTDLIFLCGLVADPFELAGEVDPKDRRRLNRAADIVEPEHPGWRRDPDARTALDILREAPSGP